MIDVGGLLLTTVDGDVTPEGGFETNTPSAVSGRVTNEGTIDADNYVAIVSPHIEQNGTVNASGNVAYIATQAADITIAGDLFDIAIDGADLSDGAVSIDHDGMTRVTADGASAAKRIYLVGVPKNDLLTMAFGTMGTLGFTLANSAAIDNQAIILGVARTISSGTDGTPPASQEVLPGGGAARSATIDGGTFEAPVFIGATATSN